MSGVIVISLAVAAVIGAAMCGLFLTGVLYNLVFDRYEWGGDTAFVLLSAMAAAALAVICGHFALKMAAAAIAG